MRFSEKNFNKDKKERNRISVMYYKIDDWKWNEREQIFGGSGRG